RGNARSFSADHPRFTSCLGADWSSEGTRVDRIALVLEGPYEERQRSHELLRALLGIFLLWLRRPPSAGPRPDSGLRYPPGYIRGGSEAVERLHAHLAQLANGDLPVLIIGETGVGKEMVARILHESSARHREPLVAINCAAIPAELLEAELFGIGKQVATGVAARQGRFAEAHRGTLLLDEVGEMPRSLQAKLLRVLQEGRVEPLGMPARDIDVRIVAATNADIGEMVETGAFRRDLYYRMAGDVVEIPPLRQRREDIPLFVEHWIRTSASALGKPVRGITVRALRELTQESWPGNLRELEHRIRRMVHRCPEHGPIDSTLLAATRRAPGFEPDSATPGPPASSHHEGAGTPSPFPGPDLDLAALERTWIGEALRRTRGNQVRAARLLGISRYQLRRRMERYRLPREPSGSGAGPGEEA
ncbi:MAG: sigma-54 dependent transcriptional regulator, partial [Holophagales bacterium]|nr:sigma-54 dependent transcriptional regulator [Holophagales bacterium]